MDWKRASLSILAALGVAALLGGLALLVLGLRQPAVDVGVIVRGLLLYSGAGALAGGSLSLGISLWLRRNARVGKDTGVTTRP